MAQRELACATCDSRFLSQAFCPSCGVPTPIATAEQRMLWEMGQSSAQGARAPSPTISLAPAPVAAPTSPADKPKPFSPVPLPRKSGAAMRTDAGRARVVPRAPTEASPKEASPPEPAASDDDAVAVETALVESKPAPRVVTGSVVRRAGESKSQPDEPAPARVVTRSDKRNAKRADRQQRKIDRLLEHLGAADGERVTALLDGTLGFRPATLLLTNYRVAIVPHARRAKPRWIPLEEVTRISCRAGSSNLVVDASVEVLRFGARRAHKLQEAVAQLRAEVKDARTARSSRRHNAVIVQAWCDRTSAIWDSPWGRARLWLDHHPKLRLFMFSPLVPLAFLIQQNL